MNRMQLAVLLVAVMLLPLAQVNAQDGKKDLAIIKKLKAAVAAGKLTEEQAKAKFFAMKKSAANKRELTATDERATENEAVLKKLKAAMKAGELTKEQAKAKLIAVKKLAAAKDKAKTDYEEIAKKLKAAVKAGKLTEEQAWKKWKAIRKKAG